MTFDSAALSARGTKVEKELKSKKLRVAPGWPGKLTRTDVRKVLDGIKGLPKGVKVELVSDVSTDGLALAHVRFPDATRRELVQEAIARAGKLLGEKVGVTEWIAFGEELESGADDPIHAPTRARDGGRGCSQSAPRASGHVLCGE